jgi:uncharacterized protein YegL
MKENLVELVFILDKSGSMSGLEKDTIGGFNSLIEKQKLESGEAIVSLVLFDSKINIVNDRVNLKEVKPLTDKEYTPSGCTALLDAVGMSINRIRNIQANLKEEDRPSRTLFIITTDGYENSSREYSYSVIKKLIDLVKEKEKFEFLFLGANIDSAEEAEKLGIDKDYSVNYINDAKGLKVNREALCMTVTNVRKNKKITREWKKEIESDFNNREK